MRTGRRAVVALAGLALVAACTSSSDSSPAPDPTPSDDPAPTSASESSSASASASGSEPATLRVMSFNIEYGGTVVGFDHIVEGARASEADVILVNEPEGHVERLAKALGWDYWNRRVSVVSQLPLLDPPDGADYVYVQTSPGRVAAVTTVHLPSSPYGPNRIKHEMTRDEVLALERETRLPALRPVIDTMGALADAGVPTFVTGDFNAPTHTDWTRETVVERPQIHFPVPWPTSEAMEHAGFTDSYRSVHPDPVADPGITWPSGRPRVDGYNPPPRSPADRIDLVWAAGPATVVDSEVVGESGGADIEVDPWGSDHRAVVSTFEIEPAAPPDLVSPAQPLVPAGAPVELDVHRPGDPGEQLTVSCAGTDVQPELGDEPDTTVTVPTDDLPPGRCRATLLDADGTRLAGTDFWVRGEGQPTEVRPVHPAYEVGEPLEVEWSLAPGNRWDWIAVAPRGKGADSYLNYIYTGGTVEGRGAIDADAAGEGTWPIPPGRYSLYLSVDDGYQQLAESHVTVLPR